MTANAVFSADFLSWVRRGKPDGGPEPWLMIGVLKDVNKEFNNDPRKD